MPARAEGSWPDLAAPAKAIGGGEHDAAVVVGVENYFAVPGVPGAKSNAGQWYDYLTETRGVPPQNVKLLTDADATREEILGSASKAAGQAGSGGTLWFVFVGHGAPSTDGKDGLLVGVDAQQKAESLQTRSVRRGELLKALAASPAGSIRVVLDACFSGRGPDGTTIAPGLQPLLTVSAAGALDPRMAVLTAAKGNQFAGSLPGENRPAFSYLVLGGLRGWAAGADGKVTAGGLLDYAKNALAATLRGRDQTPDLIGAETAVVAASAGEKGPNLAKLAKVTTGGALSFSVSDLPKVGKARQPSMAEIGRIPRAQLPGAMGQAEGIDFSAVDVDSLGKYDEAVKFERGDGSPESKAAKWRALGAAVKAYEEVSAKRAAQWDEYADQAAFNAAVENDKGNSWPEEKSTKWKQLGDKYPKFKLAAEQRIREWERYGKELATAEDAGEKREFLMGKDWAKLEKLLSYSVVSAADKRKFALTFVKAYGKTSEANPYVAELAKHLPPGTVKVTPVVKAVSASRAGKAGMKWIKVRGGSFVMGTTDRISTQPRHEVSVRSFELAKSLVTVDQYKACVDEGKCTEPTAKGTCNWGYSGAGAEPVTCLDWEQAKQFAEWAGGRLPTEAEWEFAARGRGWEQKYPWGDEEPTCARANFSGCMGKTWPACSKPAGNTKHALCDMAGNVWQWTADWYHENYEGAPADGSAWVTPASAERVVRGGGWNVEVKDVGAAVRGKAPSRSRFDSIGLRPARSL
ncbi:MAG: SUMF1/EgtB/PvdO family nonheme iron enzyme [Elusimicrobia bacterium]|nr:SUMF1/EgtB/PvdO family nonheme iron enzyme [Elusimicrobiota bacterium]